MALGHATRRRRCIAFGQLAILMVLSACEQPPSPFQIELQQRVDALTAENERLTREIEDQRAVIAELEQQVQNLRGRPDAPVVFSVERIELASLSGGTDLNGQPGDDGVVAYVKPIDAAGDVVKAAGAIKVQAFDLGGAEPKLLAECEVSDPDELRKSWYGKFLTNHYTIKCGWSSPGSKPPPRVLLRVTFTDFLTGKVLVTHQEVSVRVPPS